MTDRLTALNIRPYYQKISLKKLYDTYGTDVPGVLDLATNGKTVMQSVLLRIPLPTVYVYRTVYHVDTFYKADWLSCILRIMADRVIPSVKPDFEWMDDLFMQPYSTWHRMYTRRVEETEVMCAIVQQEKQDTLDALKVLEALVGII